MKLFYRLRRKSQSKPSVGPWSTRPARVRRMDRLAAGLCLACLALFLAARADLPSPADATFRIVATLTGDAASPCDEPIPYGIPPLEPTDQLLCKDGFVVAWDPDLRVADWVGYELTRAEATAPARRLDGFRGDPDITGPSRLASDAYRGSGFDRGHLAPAADMAFSDGALADSFEMSNVAPQIGPGFNRSIWRVLEAEMRGWAALRGRIAILTGPAYLEAPVRRFGEDGIAIPSHFWRIAIDLQRNEAAAFLLPNRALETDRLPEFVTSIDAIEAATALDLMPSLPASLLALEADVAAIAWSADGRLLWTAPGS